jgi:hypothetical protein
MGEMSMGLLSALPKTFLKAQSVLTSRKRMAGLGEDA